MKNAQVHMIVELYKLAGAFNNTSAYVTLALSFSSALKNSEMLI